ncbi:matrix metalloproteinase-15-like [Watersipora subatra]|uniref:matrix metalloproteinase-15-like n=1 Tax=Watersipora subatra TaxID=2589382 RepID=UPI00355C5C67
MPLADDLHQQAARSPSTSSEDSTTTTFSTETTPFSTTPSTINPTSDSTTDSTTPKTLSLANYQFAYSWLIHYGYIEEELVTENCTNCADDCSSDCLELLRVSLVVPLSKLQESYSLQQTNGVLSEEAMNHMLERRCRKPDYPKPSSENHGRSKRYTKMTNYNWDLETTPVLTISFKGYLSKFSREDQQRMAIECASMWAEPTSLAFQLKDLGQDTNIAIDFVRLDGPWKSIGTGQSPNYNPYSYLNLDRDEPWRLNKQQNQNQQGVSLKWAICHEMGHNMNLGHSRDPTAIMYPTGSGQDESRLGQDDRNGIVALYGRADGRTIVGNARNLLNRGSRSQFTTAVNRGEDQRQFNNRNSNTQFTTPFPRNRNQQQSSRRGQRQSNNRNLNTQFTTPFPRNGNQQQSSRRGQRQFSNRNPNTQFTTSFPVSENQQESFRQGNRRFSPTNDQTNRRRSNRMQNGRTRSSFRRWSSRRF